MWCRIRACWALALGLAWGMGLAPGMAQASIERRDNYAAIVMDHRTGAILVAHHADALRHPASLTKVMTLYMVFEALEAGRLSLNSPIRMSAEAHSRPPSRLGLPVGAQFSVETAILALITRSANDVAAAVGEHLAGSEAAFARQMTLRARQMGMTRTVFRNASGLPDAEQVTTARDMALLGQRLLRDFPQHYHYFSATHFRHNQTLIRNHNGMLADYPGMDGIKTGFTRASGFNILTSAERSGVRLVGAVFGGANWRERNTQMAALFDEGFARQGVREVPEAALAMAAAAAAGRVLTPRRVGGGPPQPVTVAARPPAPPPATAQARAQPRTQAPAAGSAPRLATAAQASRPPQPARAQAARTPAARPQPATAQRAARPAAARPQATPAARPTPAQPARPTRAATPSQQRVAGTR